MAVDTAEKRYSVIGFGDDNNMLFEMDGAVDLDDRQHLLGLYSGIALDATEQRFSWIEFASGGMDIMFQPDGTMELDHRQHMLGCYAGVAFSLPIARIYPIGDVSPDVFDSVRDDVRDTAH